MAQPTSKPTAKTQSNGPTNEPVNVNWPLLIVSWAWAGLPLAWGVVQTFNKALALFQT